jgi:Tfp pilus assembly protein PilE
MATDPVPDEDLLEQARAAMTEVDALMHKARRLDRRRRSDKVLTTLAIICLAMLAAYVPWTGARQHAADDRARAALDQRNHLQDTLDAQQHRLDAAQQALAAQQVQLTCATDTAAAFQKAVTGLLLAEVRENPNDPARVKALQDLRDVDTLLRETPPLCADASGPP